MRAIHLAVVGTKLRPVLVLTRAHMLDLLTSVTVAPITRTVRGIPTELPVGPDNGLDDEGVVSCDNIVTIPSAELREAVGWLMSDQEPALSKAIRAAFDLQ